MNVVAQETYPPAPWTLRGWGVATLQPVDLAAARRVAPPGAHVVPVWPGKTLGGLLFLAYGAGSTLQYNELNIVAGLVRFGGRFAFWLPRLYVDSAASLAGGRAIWGAPKALADFTLASDRSRTTVEVARDKRTLCRLRFRARARGLRLALPMPAVGSRDGALIAFTGRLTSRFAPVRVEVTMSADMEFAGLRLDRPVLGVRCDGLQLVVPPPHPSAGTSMAASGGTKKR